MNKLVVLFVLSGIVATSFALNCLECNLTDKAKLCGSSDVTKTCSAAGQSTLQADYCIKTTAKDGKVTEKRCKVEVKSPSKNNQCVTNADGSTTCYCNDKDKCNSAPINAINTAAFVGIVMACLAPRMFLQ